MMRATSGDPGGAALDPVKDTLRAQGYFLACTSRPETNLTVALPRDEDVSVPARIGRVTMAGSGVLRVCLEPEEPLSFRAGQYITLQRRDGLSRSYSIASLPVRHPEGGIQPVELHVRRLRGGAMSGWLASVPPGTPVRIRGPAGYCFYLPGRPEQPLVLAGTGTGIAPLAAVARDAIANGHTGPISIVHGAVSPDGLYLHDQLREFAAAQPAVRYRGCVLSGRTPGAYTGDITDAVLAEVNALTSGVDALSGVGAGVGAVLPGSGMAAARPEGDSVTPAAAGKPRGFLCGGSGSTRRTRKALFLAGLSLSEIFTDEFLPGG